MPELFRINMSIVKKLHRLFIFIFILVISLSLNGLAQNSQGENDDSIAKKYLDEGNKAEAARIYNQKAYNLRISGENILAIEYYKKVLLINTELGNEVGQMLTHSNLAMLYIEAERFEQALEHLETELKFREKGKRTKEIIPVLVTIAGVNNELGQFSDAIDIAQGAIDLSKEINSLVLLKSSYGMMFDIYTRKGDQAEAQKFFNLYSTIDRKIKEDKMVEVETQAKIKVNEAYSEKAKTEEELNVRSKELKETVENLEEAERIARQQQMELDLQQALINEQNALLRVEKLKKTFYAVGFSVLLVFLVILVLFFIRIRKANIEIENQRQKLEKQNKEIKASINYANTIQSAMLPDLDSIKNFVSSFVIYRPKDIVSGDFYWSTVTSERQMFFAVVDCTGHGVPGAFMSMIGMRALDQIINERKIDSPAEILETLNELLREALKQEQTDNNDGMDLAICRFDVSKGGLVEMTYSGAKRPVYIGRKKNLDLEILQPERKSIGGYQPTKRYIEFTNQKAQLNKEDSVFIFSDGIIDQNDPYRKKFGRARMENILKTCIDEDSEKQGQIIETKLDEFIKDESQRDDITLVGLKMNLVNV